MQPLISVVIPTYNRAESLKDAIDSVFAQSFQDFELIVVDDGSQDATAQVLGLYGNRLTAVRQPNSGASSARNTGIRRAAGEWIAFLDSDDIWHPDKLKIQAEDLRKNPQIAAHMVDVSVTYPPEQCTSLFTLRGLSQEFARRPLRDRPLLDVLNSAFFTSSWLVRRSSLENAGLFDTSIRILEDLDLLTRIALEGPFLVNCHIGAEIGRRQGGAPPLSRLFYSHQLERHQSWVSTLSRLKSDPRLTATERNLVHRGLSSARSRAAVQLWRQRLWRASIAAHLSSVNDDPGLRSVARTLLAASGAMDFIRTILRRRRKA